MNRNTRFFFTHTAALAAAVFVGSQGSASAQQISPADQEYFEAKIRPILVDYCYSCHGDGATKGGLDLGTKAGARAGGSSGEAVVPGDPGKSLVIRRMKDLGDPMPPAGKDAPSEAEIAELENWIRRGAPDPRVGKSAGVIKNEQDLAKARQHWGFQKVKAAAPPAPELVYGGKLKNWVKNPIDSYVLEGLEKHKMVPSLPAEKSQLLRRVYFDLVGIPPSFDDMQRFINGQESYEQVIDRLLNMPEYGERWGRHWLDVARYADTTGSDNRRGRLSRYIYAHTYRDWVIKAFNDDMPYDQFLINQIAADKLKKSDSDPNLAALGFLTLGPRVAGGEEIIDDRIDVITRGTMGLAVYCARCHDHKFDPVPTADYYSLYGVLNSSYEPGEADKPILHPQAASDGNPGSYGSGNPDYVEYLAEKEKLEKGHEQFRLRNELKYSSNSRENAATYMYWTHIWTKNEKRVRDNRREFERILDEIEKKRTGKNNAKSKIELHSVVGETWQRYMSRKSENDSVFGPWVVYGNVATNQFGRFMTADLSKAQQKLNPLLTPRTPKDKRNTKKINPVVARYFPVTNPPRNMAEVKARYQSLFNVATTEWMTANQAYFQKRAQAKAAGEDEPDAPKNMEDAQKRFGMAFDARYKAQFGDNFSKNMEEVRRVMFDRGHPAKYRFDDLKRNNGGLEREERDRFITKLESLKINHKGSPPRAMVMFDKGNPRDEAIMVKGNRNQRGKVVPRQFLEILSGEDRQPFKNGSGRLELAQAIASKENPLTARVMVNRIWLHHFGKGIVSSINEFGLRAADPSHPALLDYLAWYFTENGWSMKKLHKHILMSNTYQQTTEDNPRYAITDPDNIQYYKMDRRRMDFEAFRDGLLHVAGKLDFTRGGRPLRLTGGDTNYRRSVYALVDRRNLDEMFKTFDFASPDSTAGQRFTSTVSQQALFMMNSPMVADLANKIVSRPEFKNIRDDRSRITRLYNILYQRDPDPIELKLGQRFLQDQTGGVSTGGMRTPTWFNGYGQWNVIDPKNKLYSVNFRQFPFTDGKEWKGNSPAFGPLKLTGNGGHPGIQPNVAVIRRWVSPMDTTINISGRLEHQLDDEADAVYKEQIPEAQRKWYDENAWDGVTGIIVRSRAVSGGSRIGKELWRSDVRRGRRDANYGDLDVKKGDVIDFIVTCRKLTPARTLAGITQRFKLKNPQQDQFTWNPTVRIKDDIAKAMERKAGSLLVTSWTASEEFQGATYKPKPLTAWEKYVQVLLLSNELAYLD
mgnify:FL=1